MLLSLIVEISRKNKAKGITTAAQVAASMAAVAPRQLEGNPPLPAAHHFFAPRSSPLPHQYAFHSAASALNIEASVLREANGLFHLGFTAAVNPHILLSLMSTNLYTPTFSFSPVDEALTNRLHKSFPVGNKHFLPFRPALNEVQIVICRLPYSFMPKVDADPLPALAKSIQNTAGVGIYAARFLQSDPVKRAKRSSGSLVVSVSPTDVGAFVSSICLFWHSRQVEHGYSSNPMSQCKYCFGFGHATQCCKSHHPVCPICSLSYHSSAH